MPEPNAPAAPIPALSCPICGGPNACAAAASGSFDTPCWCRDVTFPPDLIARVPLEQRGQACICRRCASPDLPPADGV